MQGAQMEMMDENLKTYLVTSIMMGGVLVINTVSLSLGMMGNLIKDLEQKKLDGFLVTPVKRYKVIFSYYLSATIITATLTLLMWVFTIIYVGVLSGYWYSFETISKAVVLIIIFTLISSTLMVYLTTILRSVNAFGTLSGVLGTLIGFASGIYMPLVILGEWVSYFASLVPFTHMNIMLRSVLLKGPYEILSQYITAQEMAEIELIFGTTEIGVLGMEVSMYAISAATIGIGAALLYFAYRNMTKKLSN
jgi:multidrug/hemolysin transport system permease protein